jgi:hypothetical protein
LSFHLLPRPGFSIENVEVAEDPDFGAEPLARVDRIDCDLRWHSLWRSRMDFSRLHLDHPSFNMVLSRSGEWNVRRLLLESGVTAPLGAAPGAAPTVAAEQLDMEVDDARINFQVGPNKKSFALTEVAARLQVNPTERRVQFRITASPVRSDLSIPTPGPVEAEGTWTPGKDLHGPFSAHLTMRGALLYDWVPMLTGRNPGMYGVVDADVRLGGSLPDLTLEGETHLTQLHRWEEPPPSDPMPWMIRFRGELVRGHERLLVDSLDASVADSHLHLSGSVDHLQANPQMDLVVSLERSRLEDAVAVARRLWPSSSVWNLKGRVDAMLAIQGPWTGPRYGGFVGARQVSLETPSGSYPVSEIAIRIKDSGARLAPVEVRLGPRVELAAEGLIDRTSPAPRFDLQLSAKGLPVRDLLSFGRGLGLHAFQGLDATGSATAVIHIAGGVWPPARPVITARAEVRAARLLIPGLTEPLNVPRASLQIIGDQISVGPLVAVIGTSVFNGQLLHRGARANPWQFDLHANGLRLEEGALWFDALGLRRPLPLLERLPGLASSTARREAASQLFGSLHAEGKFATPSLSYRGVTLKDFAASFEVAARTIRMKAAKFRTGGGTGEAEGTADLTLMPPILTAKTSLTGLALQSWAERLPVALRGLRGSLNAAGNFQTHGLGREDLAQNLAGQISLRVRDISLGEFDPLGALAQRAHWGTLEPLHSPVALPPLTLDLRVRDRHLILPVATLDLNGAALRCAGTYVWGGDLNLNVHADLRRLRRHWLAREDDLKPDTPVAEVRLVGPVGNLSVNALEGVAALGRSGGEGQR